MAMRDDLVVAEAGEVPDWVSRIAAGDREAEALFVSQYARGVRALVRRRCRPQDPIVEDLAQEVLTRVLEKLRVGAIRDPAALPAYVQATITYTTSAEYRSRRLADTAVEIDAIASNESPCDRLASTQLSSLLRALLKQLPVERDREVLARFYLDEEDKDVVCRQLGIDAAHFHRVVFRARERFRQLLDRNGIEEA
jgi:RNA polymerase sigma-70 factor, ECF subfamily